MNDRVTVCKDKDQWRRRALLLPGSSRRSHSWEERIVRRAGRRHVAAPLECDGFAAAAHRIKRTARRTTATLQPRLRAVAPGCVEPSRAACTRSISSPANALQDHPDRWADTSRPHLCYRAIRRRRARWQWMATAETLARWNQKQSVREDLSATSNGGLLVDSRGQ